MYCTVSIRKMPSLQQSSENVFMCMDGDTTGLEDDTERLLPYSGKLWRAIYLAKCPILAFGEFIFGGLPLEL